MSLKFLHLNFFLFLVQVIKDPPPPPPSAPKEVNECLISDVGIFFFFLCLDIMPDLINYAVVR